MVLVMPARNTGLVSTLRHLSTLLSVLNDAFTRWFCVTTHPLTLLSGFCGTLTCLSEFFTALIKASLIGGGGSELGIVFRGTSACTRRPVDV